MTTEQASFAERLRSLSPEQRELLERQMAQEGLKASGAEIPRREPGRRSFPLSFPQQRLWFLHRLAPQSTAYHVCDAARLSFPLEVAALERAFEEIVRRHEALRTVFRAEAGRPVQVVLPAMSCELPVIDLRGLPGAVRRAEGDRLAAGFYRLTFDLEHGPLLRTALLRLAADEHLSAVSMHHIVSDFWSMRIFLSEMTRLYRAFAAGEGSPLPALPVQYPDFSAWQRERFASGALDPQLAYWREQLSEAPPRLELPTDRSRAQSAPAVAAVCSVGASPALAGALTALAERSSATLYMPLLAAYQALLARLSGQTRFAVGSTIANRNRREIEPLIGFFVNTRVLRAEAGGEPTFLELVDRARRVVLDADANQDLPFEKVVEVLSPERAVDSTPFFQVTFNMLSGGDAGTAGDADAAAEPAPLTCRDDFGLELPFELVMRVVHAPGRLAFHLFYRKALFDTTRIHRMLRQYLRVLEAVAEDPQLGLSALPLTAASERHQVLSEWNDNAVSRDPAATVAGLFEAQADRTPDAEALRFDGEGLSYRELEARANRLARHLRSLGVGCDMAVGVCVERSMDLAVAVLGVLKAGAGYLPLDPDYPASRLAFMAEDSGLRVLVTQRSLAGALPELPLERVLLDADAEAIAAHSAERLPPAALPEGLCYAIYTSGSTGRPKGTLVTHRAVVNRLGWWRESFGLEPGERVLQKTPLSFDVSVWELLWPLTAGGTAVLARPGGHQDAAYLRDLLAAEGISIVHFVPSMLRLFLEQPRLDSCRSLRRLVASGEALTRDLVERFEDRFGTAVALYNMYGPSEAARATSAHVAGLPGRPVVPIGRPVPNNEAYVLDRRLRPVPLGAAGELVLGSRGGVSLTRGYHRRPALTAEKLVPDPFGGLPGGRLYRTGDLVRHLADGRIEFLGRIDHQVKLRGQRVELGEVEAVLEEHPAVHEVAVVVRQGESGEDQRLVAYLAHDEAALPEETAEDRAEQVAQWSAVFEQTYTAFEDEDPTFLVSGWVSSYTGEQIPDQEMREWVEETVARVLAREPCRVLEVGSGNGLLLYRIAPHTEAYRGTDFSRVALERVESHLATLPELAAKVELAERTADDFTGTAPRSRDAVVINSVAQYFPSVAYLLEVVEKAVEAVEAGGFVFLGDLRSLPLLRACQLSVELYQAADELPVAELLSRVGKRLLQEEELVVDPAFFHALASHLPRVSRVEVLPKRGRFHNELSRFRYDVFLEVEGQEEATPTKALAWEDASGATLEELRRRLEAEPSRTLALRGIPNARLGAEARALALLEAGAAGGTVGELRGKLSRAAGIDLEDLFPLAEELGREIRLSWAETGPDGRFDAVLWGSGQEARRVGFPGESSAPRPWHRCANHPLRARFARRWLPALQRWAKERLPEHMVPGTFVLLDALPLTPSGKVDRAALPAPDASRPELEGAYQPPSSELEASLAVIWRDVLGLDRVGVDDNFFDLGGHSLLLVQVHSRLVAEIGREVPLMDLFRYPSISALARSLGAEAEAASRAETGRRRASLRRGTAAQAQGGVAIVGMSLRVPGASSPDALWRNLRQGVESISYYSDEELLEAGIPAAELALPGYVRAQGYLGGVDLFDAPLFGISPREAQLLDPQQRVFLECAWEALERACYDPATWPGSIGVYAGVGISQYWANLLLNPEVAATATSLQLSLGNEKDFLPTRLSYKLNLRGPSVNVNTACSTGLVAAHLACQALLRRECDLALAGGVALGAHRRGGYVDPGDGVISADGHTRTFDAAATGTIDSDGAGLVVLKRLDDARQDGDTIHAVIKGSAINNDGAAKVGFTAPSIDGQAEVIAEALAVAGVDPAEISYVEAHGTATPLGDPIEVAALKEVFGTEPGRRCGLGSIKSNLGHLGAAAGAAGLIKTVLALEHGEIPPSLHFETPNPQIDFEASPFYVPTEVVRWPAGEGPRRAGVSSFGLGGTNAHVVLEEAPAPRPSGPSRDWQLLPLSAASPAALDALSGALARRFEEDPGLSLADAAFSLQVGRQRLAHRRVALCRAAGGDAAEVLEGDVPGRLLTAFEERRQRKVAFLLPGVGDHYPGMGLGLYRTEPAFRGAVDRCAEVLRPLLGLDLREVLYPQGVEPTEGDGGGAGPDLKALLGRQGGGPEPESRLDRTLYAQPAVFVAGYALAELWQEWGIEPESLIGYSLGEYTAACLAGVLELEDALTLVAERAKLIDSLPEGAMTAVPLAPPELPPLGEGLAVAAENGPQVTVVAGTVEAVAAFEAALAAREVLCRRLRSRHAFHSEAMRPIAERFEKVARRMKLQAPRIPYVSNVTGTWITDRDARDPAYWVRHLCRTVRFAGGLGELLTDPDRVLVEVGPGQALSTSARRHPALAEGAVVVTSLRDARDLQADTAFLLGALGRLWLAGAAVDWKGFARHETRNRVSLPTYPFQHQSYWVERAALAPGPAPAAPDAKQADLADWFLVPRWKPAELRPVERPAAGPHLVFLDPAGLGEALAEALEGRGDAVLRVEMDGSERVGGPFEALGSGRFRLDPRSPQGFEKLAEALAAEGLAPGSVVHLGGVAGPGFEASPEAREELLDRCFYSLLFLSRTLAALAGEAPPRLLAVTDELHPLAGGESAVVEKAAVLGPCRSLPHELPGLRAQAVDVRLGDGPGLVVAQLLEELDAGAADLAVALRAGERFVQEMEPVRLEARETGRHGFRLRHRGCYVVTGGLGGIGRTLAEGLARRAQARLLIVGRSELEPGPSPARERLEALEAAGAEVLYAAADVADAEALTAAVAQARERFGPVRGVVHTAGLPAGGLAQLKDREDAGAILRAKIGGTRALERALGEDLAGLDFFAASASMTGVLGAVGQVDYCAANAFLDAFAAAWKPAGRPGLAVSLDWGLWREVGMGARASVAEHFEGEHQRALALAMTPEEGLEAFWRALDRGHPQLVVCPRSFEGAFAEGRAWTREGFAGHLAEGRSTLGSFPRPALGTPYAEPEGETQVALAAVWQELLGIEKVGAHDNFFELGGDSLLATQVVSRLRRLLKVELPLNLFFEAPTVAEMAAAVASGDHAQSEEELSALEEALLRIETLSEEELDEVLETEGKG